MTKKILWWNRTTIYNENWLSKDGRPWWLKCYSMHCAPQSKRKECKIVERKEEQMSKARGGR
jgi:hypothetical protein